MKRVGAATRRDEEEMVNFTDIGAMQENEPASRVPETAAKKRWKGAVKQILRDHRVVNNLVKNDERKLVALPKWRKQLTYPKAGLRMTWNVFFGLILFYDFVMSPLRLAFDEKNVDTFWDESEHVLNVIANVLDAFYIIDLIWNFFILYRDAYGKWVIDTKLVAMHYLHTSFFVDFLTAIPFSAIGYERAGRLIKLLRTLRFFMRFSKMKPMMLAIIRNIQGKKKRNQQLSIAEGLEQLREREDKEETGNMSEIFDDAFRAIRLIFALAWLAHVLGCMWIYISGLISPGDEISSIGTMYIPPHYIGGQRVNFTPMIEEYEQRLAAIPDTTTADGYLEYEGVQSVLIHLRQLEDNYAAPFTYLYVMGIYWAITTMTTVGYGDISASTMQESIFAAFVMLVGIATFSFTVSEITTVVLNIAKRRAYTTQINVFDSFLVSRLVPRHIRKRVTEYLYFSEARRRAVSEPQEVKEMISILSPALRKTVMFQIRQPLLMRFAFYPHFEKSCLRYIAAQITVQYFGPSETIYFTHATDLPLYLLAQGRAQAFDDQNHLLYYKKGSTFGEIEVMTGRSSRVCSMRAVGFSELYELTEKDFRELLRVFPETKEYFDDAVKGLVPLFIKRGCEELALTSRDSTYDY
mmetsp:Transcript_18507/g.46562  ORF Transcript_18507/g.46562 Transcript_18507/m.46562 type:complete len:636 (-) Transcript_18507:242-2149(-)